MIRASYYKVITGQSLIFTKNVGQGFLFHSTPPTGLEGLETKCYSIPHLLHNGLSDSPSRWRCLLRVLCPVRRPVTALDWVLLKDRNLALTPRLGPEINSEACLWVSPWLTFLLLITLLQSWKQYECGICKKKYIYIYKVVQLVLQLYNMPNT
jgi:hypothetical protein